MNSTLKTTLIVIVVVLVAWAIYGMVQKNNPNMMGGDNNASTSVQADRSTGVPANTSGSQNTVVPTNGGTTSGAVMSDSALSMLIGNTLITVPQTGVDVALSASNADYTSGAVKGHVSVGKILGRITTESGTDVVAEMNLTKTSSPTLLKYVAMFHNVGDKVTYTSAILVGDRVTISGITVTTDKSVTNNPGTTFMNSALGYNFTVSYLDRKNGEPLTATPSVPKSMTVHVKNHSLATN